MKLICPDCGKQYETGKFCLECGAKLQKVSPELVCPSCGYKTKAGKFCPECGTKLTEQSIVPTEVVNNEPKVRKFNKKDERFAKYYNRKGFPRELPQEERAIAIERLKPFANQGIAEAKMLLGNILIQENPSTGFQLLKEAEEAGDKFAYYLMGIAYMFCLDDFLVMQNHTEAEKRLLECYQEFEDEDIAGMLAQLYTFSDEKCDYKKALEYATIAAEDDSKDGYAVLGALYHNGWGVEQNQEFALENYKMAAAHGDGTSMNQIGIIYMGSDDFKADPKQAFYWFNEAAQKGSDVGMNNLAYCYKNGFGVDQDVEIAAEWFKKSAETGSVDAMFELGQYYQNVLIDSSKAKMWYLKAAELGHAEAINYLGVIYIDDEGNYEEAIKCFEKAVEMEVPMAYRNLAICYRDGSGVKQDLKKAEELFAKATEFGVEDVNDIKDDMLSSQEDEQIDIANSLFAEGKQKEAINVYKKLAEKGNARAQGNYGKCLLYALGIKQNLKEGIAWLEKSAEQEYAWSCLRLAEAYAGCDYNGNNIKVDTEKAIAYLKKALAYGADSNEVNQLARMTIPSVDISNIKVNRDVKENGSLGLVVSFKMIANAMIGRKLNISVHCVSKDGNKRCLRKPGTSVGNPMECCYLETLQPNHTSTVWYKYKVFIPYAMILNIQAKQEKTLVIMAWDQTNNTPLYLASEELPFTISCVTHTFRSNEWNVTLHKQDPSKKLVNIRKKVVSLIDTDSSSKQIEEYKRLPMDEIKKAAKAKYPKESLKNIAIAALKIAEVIQERIPYAEVSYMVHPSEFDSQIHKDALPIHFLFKKNGVPKVAVVAVTSNGYKTPLVVETQRACEVNNIEYVRVYADGTYSDWIQDECDPSTVEFCKNWLVDKINNSL